MELPRQDPDQLLHAIRNDASTKKSGKLKIFFGYAAGVGKTYAMLQAAHQAKERGIDVVAGIHRTPCPTPDDGTSGRLGAASCETSCLRRNDPS